MGAVVLIAIFLAYGFGRYGWKMFGFDDDDKADDDNRKHVADKWAAWCLQDEKAAREATRPANHKIV
ncbi:hypothetical protein [Loigolactobacillus rennini]|nr:hypothetical protein [Loigolactobacillus rennini]